MKESMPQHDKIDHLSRLVSDKVSRLEAGPALALAAKKIREYWPQANFTRISESSYSLDGFVFVDAIAYKVMIEAGALGHANVIVKTKESYRKIVSRKLDSEFPEKFPDMLAEAIVELRQY